MIVADDAEGAARLAADQLVRACSVALEVRGRACVAFSGGSTPRRMLELFAKAKLPWASIVVAQVDERCVPPDDSRRNLRVLRRALVEDGPLPGDDLLAMPAEGEALERGAEAYAAALAARLGPQRRFDVVQLGLGEDGHTASLVPGDAVLEVTDRAVAVTQPYQGTRRMTLTYPVLAAAGERLWLVTGAAKARALRALLDGTGDTPAVHVKREDSVVIADRAAAT